MPSSHFILCHSLLLPSIFLSFKVFYKESVLGIRWSKYWIAASASVLPMDIQDWFPLELIGFISLQSKGLRHPYMTTGKTITLIRWTFVGKVTYLLFNMLSKLFITLLPRSKHPLISWPQSLSAVNLECKNSLSLVPLLPIYFPLSDGTRCHDLSFLNDQF